MRAGESVALWRTHYDAGVYGVLGRGGGFQKPGAGLGEGRAEELCQDRALPVWETLHWQPGSTFPEADIAPTGLCDFL